MEPACDAFTDRTAVSETTNRTISFAGAIFYFSPFCAILIHPRPVACRQWTRDSGLEI